MPGDLEAPLILANTRTGVKRKSGENPYFTRISGWQAARWREQASATKPESRAPKAAKRTLDAGARHSPNPADNGPRRRPRRRLTCEAQTQPASR
jgi:hypothetical protein